MKMTFLLTAALALTFFSALAESSATNTPALLRLGALDAQKHYDETAIVTGKVIQVSIRPKLVFLNLDKPHPGSPFAAVIFSKDTNGFGNLKSLEGKSVEISGKIKEFNDAPEIVISSTNQLTVITNSSVGLQK